MELRGKKINFLGDSITRGQVGPSDESYVYHQVLKRSVGLSEARNYGINGTTIARRFYVAGYGRTADDVVGPSGVSNLYFKRQKEEITEEEKSVKDEYHFVTRVDAMDADADILVVFGGTNDYGVGDVMLGEFSDRTENTFYGACHLLFQKLIQRYPGKPIVVITPLHRVDERHPCFNGFPNHLKLLDFVTAIREVAEYYSLPVLDLYKESGIQPELPVLREMYVPDGLHPNDAGHAVIADKLEKFLRAL